MISEEQENRNPVSGTEVFCLIRKSESGRISESGSPGCTIPEIHKAFPELTASQVRRQVDSLRRIGKIRRVKKKRNHAFAYTRVKDPKQQAQLQQAWYRDHIRPLVTAPKTNGRRLYLKDRIDLRVIEQTFRDILGEVKNLDQQPTYQIRIRLHTVQRWIHDLMEGRND